ncbi:NUDIX domain-containing protein [bacterium]|nr:NUDIX domain-containing protein [bacterium]
MQKSSTIIFQNDQGEILLFLRDDKPDIPDPNKWDLFGGFGEEGETPEQTIVREMKEEIEIDLEDFKLFKTFKHPNKEQTVFYKKLNIDPSETPLNEGQKMKYFSEDEILEMDLANIANQILEEFLK